MTNEQIYDRDFADATDGTPYRRKRGSEAMAEFIEDRQWIRHEYWDVRPNAAEVAE